LSCILNYPGNKSGFVTEIIKFEFNYGVVYVYFSEGESCIDVAALLYALEDISHKRAEGLDECSSGHNKWKEPRKRRLSPTKSQDLLFKNAVTRQDPKVSPEISDLIAVVLQLVDEVRVLTDKLKKLKSVCQYQRKTGGRKNERKKACWTCGSESHLMSECPNMNV